MSSLPILTLDLFHEAATEFSATLKDKPFPSLYGATDGKKVGTTVEAEFKQFLIERYTIEVGNAAQGLDFPSLNLDLKVTSSRQPQSSCPFKSATQKIYGLGYNLLVIVYDKRDVAEEEAGYLDIKHVIFIDKKRTADSTLTKAIRSIVEEIDKEDPTSEEIAVEEIDALLQDRNLPLDEVSRLELSRRLVSDVPEEGVLTISNAQQWRLQYKRAISYSLDKKFDLEVVDLHKVDPVVNSGE